MKLSSSRNPETRSVRPDDIRIGKDVIEILTSGMYVSPLSIYREYVQNSADAIDALHSEKISEPGRVTIDFDHPNRSVTIRDNGGGIPAQNAVDVLMAVGGSQKRGSAARGFRGVGRLSGLAYCRQIEFVTKSKNDDSIVSLTWDCRMLREAVASSSAFDDLRSVMAAAVTVKTEPATVSEPGFFEVRLKEIARLRNDLLLNEHFIADYLSQVAPVPFAADFSFAPAIEAHFRSRIVTQPVELVVGGKTITRPHRDVLTPGVSDKTSVIREIEFFELADVDGDVGAVGWLAHHDYVRSLPTSSGVRGLRARVGDLQVGEANLFEDSFKETRFNSWTVGEIHILDRRVLPNARRDNFEMNHHLSNLLVQIGPIASKISQRCRQASISRTALQSVVSAVQVIEDRLKQKTRIDRAELSNLKAAATRASAKVHRVESEQDKKKITLRIGRVQKKLSDITRRGPATVALSAVANLVSKFVTNRGQAEKLIAEIRKLDA